MKPHLTVHLFAFNIQQLGCCFALATLKNSFLKLFFKIRGHYLIHKVSLPTMVAFSS